MLLTHYGYYAPHPRPWGTYYDDNFMQDPRFYDRHLGDSKRPTPCFARGKDLVIPPWKEPRFWRKALADPALRGPAAIRRHRAGLVFFAGDLGNNRLAGYSHDLRQRAFALFCDPHTIKFSRRDCTPIAGGKCRTDMPMNCSLWQPGVTIKTHSQRRLLPLTPPLTLTLTLPLTLPLPLALPLPRYHDELKQHTFCLAFPGDGWSSRVLDAVPG